MDKRLQDRIAIITGASSGIGAATAHRFAASGARIVVADLRSTGTESAITSKHGPDAATFIKCDVTSDQDIAALIPKAVEWGGKGRLDIMCNFAGIAVETGLEVPQRVHEMDVAMYEKTFAVNVRGVWLCSKYALKQMMEQEPREANARGDRPRGWVVNAASMFGLVAVEQAPCYVPSKHAVVGMTRQMALDYAADRIHINCLCPGYVDSPFLEKLTADPEAAQMIKNQHPWTGLGKPEDVADAALFLAGDEAAWVSGHTLTVDGAYTCR